VTLETGYFDQPHFNHEFREFAGMTPSEYMERRITGEGRHVREGR